MQSGRRPTAYLHIGPHKTGSSSIQQFCRANLERLAGHGLYFPLLIGENGKPARNHEELGRAPEIRRNGELKPRALLWPEIEIACGEGMDVLLSSEMFRDSFAAHDVFARILSFFETRGYDVAVIAYVRDQPAWLNSRYVQSQKRLSGLLSFDAFCAAARETGAVDPGRLLQRFVDEPRCTLEVVSFEQAARSGLELDFIRRCGVPAEARLEQGQLFNPNAGTRTVYAAQEIMRRAGPRLMRLDGFGPVYTSFKLRCQELGFDRTPFVALDQKTYEHIRAHYAAGNDAFARTHFGTGWNELCPPRSYEVSAFDPTRASRRELDEIEDLVATTVDGLAALQPRRGARRARDASAR